MAYTGVNFETVFRWGGYTAFAVAIAGFAIFQPLAKPDPPNSAAYGCYAANAAPAILLDRSGMSIRQRGFLGIPFHLERGKTGIVLTADAPIMADKTAGKYLYSIEDRGIGRFLEFQKIEGGRRYGQFDDTQLSMFVMLASDGAELFYNKAPVEDCQTTS